MVKTLSGKLLVGFTLSIAFLFIIFSIQTVSGQEEPFAGAKGKMEGISQNERETLSKLFIQVQEIEGMEQEGKEVVQDIAKVGSEVEGVQKAITEEGTNYSKKRENLEKVLKSYQRMGPGSYIEIILQSKDLPDLLRRINILRDLTRNTGKLLEQIKESRDKQAAEKVKLSEKLAAIENKQEQLRAALRKKKQLKEEMEEYIASLKEEKEYYQDYLNRIQQSWDEMKPFFSRNIKEFSDRIEREGIPPELFKISFNLLSVRGTMEEKNLNSIIEKNLPSVKAEFRLHPAKAEMRLPEKNLILRGKFVIVDGHSIKFEVEEGSFLDIPLEASAIKALFNEDYLVLNLKSQLGRYTLSSVDVNEGNIDFTIKLW